MSIACRTELARRSAGGCSTTRGPGTTPPATRGATPPPAPPRRAWGGDESKDEAGKLAAALNVRGLMNIQFAVSGLRPDGQATAETPVVYILEANPRASRTVPFVSKATGVPLARLASLVMVGKTL